MPYCFRTGNEGMMARPLSSKAFLALVLTIGSAVISRGSMCLAQPAADAPAAPASRPATVPVDPAAAARLAALGSRDVRLHDPSAVVRCKDEYWVFSTGAGVASHRSKDLKKWEPGPRVFPGEGPHWVRETIPANRRGNDFWAPDVVRVGDRYFLYYSVSSWGKNTSAIALATNRTLDPADPDYRWVDEGVVVRSEAGRDDFNAIDPAPVIDVDGRMWLAFGSFWGGIKMVELDPATGRRVSPDSQVYSLAQKEQIEGPYIVREGGHYYMFVAWGWCCRGVNSTYNIRVGRADRITGPYFDREGRDMRDGGGTLLLESDGPFIGPGQPSVFSEPDASGRADKEAARHHLVCHFYDATRRGRATLAIRPLAWDAAGWPIVVRESAGD
jgi:arabinan endo-1,5-alpha-L-arabinosidase